MGNLVSGDFPFLDYKEENRSLFKETGFLLCHIDNQSSKASAPKKPPQFEGTCKVPPNWGKNLAASYLQNSIKSPDRWE